MTPPATPGQLSPDEALDHTVEVCRKEEGTWRIVTGGRP